MSAPVLDSNFCRFKLTWDAPRAQAGAEPPVADSWMTTRDGYKVNIQNFSGGPAAGWFTWHPTTIFYGYAPWGAKLHIELYAVGNPPEVVTDAEASKFRSTPMISKDIVLPQRPGNATGNLDYPNQDHSWGLDPDSQYGLALVPFVPDDPENWLWAETTFIGPLKYYKNGQKFFTLPDGPLNAAFVALLFFGVTYTQTTILHYPDDVTQTYIHTFVAGE